MQINHLTDEQYGMGKPNNTAARMVFVHIESNGFPELVFIAENAHDAKMIAIGIEVAQCIESIEEAWPYTGDELSNEFLKKKAAG